MAITVRHDLEDPVVGFVLESAQGPGTVNVRPRGFFTSDDGAILYTYLDSLFAVFGSALLKVGVRPEIIRNCLINITDGKRATINLNFETILHTIAKGPVRAGELATLDKLADVRGASFRGIETPTRGAVAYIFEHGWRRGLYFDFSMVPDEPNRPLTDFASVIGSLHTALLFRERIQMEPEVLAAMFATGWFPFIRLPHDLALGLYRHVEEGWDHAPVEAEIVRVLSPSVSVLARAWSSKPAFAPHMGVITEAASHFEKGEYMATAAMLLPKVEGILRTLNMGRGRASARDLRANLLARVRAQVTGITAFLPEAFVQYLEDFYYAGFDLDANDVPPSRHAFTHGVGPDAELAKPSYAMKLILTLDQLSFYV
jgi:hypothetical protein